MFWHKDLVRNGSISWAYFQQIGTGWNYSYVFYGGSGVIYAVDANGDLYWFKDLAQDGSMNWANNGVGQKIASGWIFQ